MTTVPFSAHFMNTRNGRLDGLPMPQPQVECPPVQYLL
ncbi:hypothetical protein CAter282_4237 [Collimonas arenae]|uniref:Uncharacterized protein n=1 Tax=Collimonas arenae TaxID=279058 RepID=A0A127PVZ9_9BURK|nr:hypothetical protein CAter10_4611 [Collimonas arenae]AMP11897.1 hypothetical protein CAter282_4237 [Collimonas arenae]